jgi:antitoxin PrlF
LAALIIRTTVPDLPKTLEFCSHGSAPAKHLSFPAGGIDSAMLGNTTHKAGITEAQMTVRVTRKGQVTIPKPVRDRLGIKPGSQLDFEIAEDGRAFFRKVGRGRVPPSRFERMRGTATTELTTDEIMALTRGDV